MLNYNIRSFNNNSSNFESFLGTCPFNHDIIVLTETWNSVNHTQICNINGYKAFHVCREGRSGGVSIYCSDEH